MGSLMEEEEAGVSATAPSVELLFLVSPKPNYIHTYITAREREMGTRWMPLTASAIHLATHLFGCVAEKKIEVSLDNSKLIIRLHVWPHPLWQLLQGVLVAKPGWSGIVIFCNQGVWPPWLRPFVAEYDGSIV